MGKKWRSQDAAPWVLLEAVSETRWPGPAPTSCIEGSRNSGLLRAAELSLTYWRSAVKAVDKPPVVTPVIPTLLRVPSLLTV